MEIRFRLAELFDKCGEPRHGLIKRICNKTQLERHQVSSLLKNTVQRVPLEVLEEICNYLVKEHRMDPDLLPGALFKLEMSDFWSMLGEREHIEISFGMRRESKTKRRWVMASDSLLHGVLLQELSGAGLQHSRSLEQRLLTAPDTDGDMSSDEKIEELIKGALMTHKKFEAVKGSKAHICVGSVKSNFMVETVLAHIFDEEPFTSKDNIKKAVDRGCPIYCHYRDVDPKPPSCHGGVQLSKERRNATPGIWYETEGQSWVCCPSDEMRDAAVVAYAFHPNTGRLDMVMGGYSGRATESLAENLKGMGKQFWPPTYVEPDLNLGVFIVKFNYGTQNKKRKKSGNNGFSGTDAKWKVKRVDKKVLKRKLELNPTKRKKTWW